MSTIKEVVEQKREARKRERELERRREEYLEREHRSKRPELMRKTDHLDERHAVKPEHDDDLHARAARLRKRRGRPPLIEVLGID